MASHATVAHRPGPEAAAVPPVILTDSASAVTEDGIFGPALPMLPYDIDAATRGLSPAPPLAFCAFTGDPKLRERLLGRIVAGGVGYSGMGACHGKAGFKRMSHLAPVFTQARLNGSNLIAPPYGARFRTLMKLMLR